jgi:DNA polymerase-3 subunit beta
MKAYFDKQTLLAAIAPAASIAQTKNTMAAVDGILFECPPNPKFGEFEGDGQNQCRISAFDLEKGLRTTIPCRTEEEGMYVINTVKMLQIVRALPEGEIAVEIGERGRVTLSSGFSKFEITAAPGEDFPSMPRFVGDSRCLISQRLLRTMIGETVFSVAQNDQRAAFNGALFRINDGRLTVVGCDGNRLSAARCEVTLAETGEKSEMIIPGKFLTELSRLLRDTDEDAEMIIGRKNIIFRIDGTYFFTRMLDTEYMAYERLLPQTYMTQAYVSRSELLDAVQRASIVTEDKLGGSGRSHVKLDFDGREITMSSVSAGGSVYEKIPAAIDGAPLSIGFNCRYLLEALKACPADCERLRIRLNTPLMGVVIEPSEGTTFLDAKPDASVYGERETAGAPAEKEYREDMFMYFVMPIRMNG